MNVHEKFFSKVGLNYLALGVITIIFQIIIANIINVINPQYLNDYNIISIISTICNYFLPFPIFYWLMKKIESEKPEKTRISAKTFLIYAAITLTLMWIGNFIGLTVTSLLSSTMQSDIVNPVHELINNTDIWFNMIVISIVAPIFEEILFRKLLIDRTIRYGAKVSIILSALLFALFHGNLNQFFYTLMMGGFLAYVYIRTGNVIYPIVLHGIANIMGSVVSLFIVSAANGIQSGANPLGEAIIIIYILFIFSMLVIGLYSLTKFKKARFNGAKTKIALEYTYTTMFMNPGMVCFIVFYLFEMVFQVLG